MFRYFIYIGSNKINYVGLKQNEFESSISQLFGNSQACDKMMQIEQKKKNTEI